MPEVGAYDVGDILGKTLVAAKDLPVYDFPDTPRKVVGTIKKGNPVGIVYSWLNVDPAKGRTTIWWQFSPATNYSNYYYAPHESEAFDLSSLQAQGVLTIEEKKAKADYENMEWYEKVIHQVLTKVVPVVLVIGLGGPLIKGLVSRKSENK